MRNHNRPDFELEHKGKTIFIEAVTANPSCNQEIENKMDLIRNKLMDITDADFEKYMCDLRDQSVIRLAGALYSKLQANYQKKALWIVGHPFVLATQPFHHSLSHWLSDSNLLGYLYGIDHSWKHDDKGNLHIETMEIGEHKYNSQEIPSNLFMNQL